MVWSDSVGVSIVLPSDKVSGDGRNFITIGEDVPTEIASAFTAALIFRSGFYEANSTNPNTLFPNGFAYWAFGITTAGALEIVSYYYVVSAGTGGAVAYFRQTVFSVSPPTQVDFPPVLRLGSGGSFSEGPTTQVRGNITPRVSRTAVILSNAAFFQAFGDPNYDDPFYYITADGLVVVSGLLKIMNVSFFSGAVMCSMPAGARPGNTKIFALAGFNNVPYRCDVKANGDITWNNYLGPGGSAAVGNYMSLSGIQYMAEV